MSTPQHLPECHKHQMVFSLQHRKLIPRCVRANRCPSYVAYKLGRISEPLTVEYDRLGYLDDPLSRLYKRLQDRSQARRLGFMAATLTTGRRVVVGDPRLVPDSVVRSEVALSSVVQQVTTEGMRRLFLSDIWKPLKPGPLLQPYLIPSDEPTDVIYARVDKVMERLNGETDPDIVRRFMQDEFEDRSTKWRT